MLLLIIFMKKDLMRRVLTFLLKRFGLDGFVEFIEGPIVELNEAEKGRPAKKDFC